MDRWGFVSAGIAGGSSSPLLQGTSVLEAGEEVWTHPRISDSVLSGIFIEVRHGHVDCPLTATSLMMKVEATANIA